MRNLNDIFVDMDEVLVDLSRHVRETVNKECKKNYPKGFNKSYWWRDYGLAKPYFEELLNRKKFFYNAKPVEGAVKYLEKLRDEGYNIHILTLPQYNAYCFFDKVRWIKKYLPWINIETNFHTSGNKALLAKKNRVLIDDNGGNLNPWTKSGGIGIAFGDFNWNKDAYDSISCFNWEQVYNVITKLNTLRRIDSVYGATREQALIDVSEEGLFITGVFQISKVDNNDFELKKIL